ncbi:MAG: protein-glutamate O-methyltransferase CheR [Pseudohongiella sp.]|nr:protein-glutamate O-methyltransferase CheR [Pseudohongiella sp.]MDO9520530.1 protein-glutamate O-methyltransferase CheR [Pseudohongiella sp.]MDP2126462.1 protein-glutamate O-methyltransferase CheR [Pseudohongiella sp.]
MMESSQLNDAQLKYFQTLVAEETGMRLAAGKRNLVVSRLSKRLRELELDNFSAYISLVSSAAGLVEKQTVIDLLTTNETYFFREQPHFDFLKKLAIQRENKGGPLRVWSAACSSGQEAFSIAMVLHDCLGTRPWEIVGSDISLNIVNKAKAGVYPLAEKEKIPPEYLKSYCLRGTGKQEGKLQVCKELRDRVSFRHESLLDVRARQPAYDIIFLRNVLIYFDAIKKQELVRQVITSLRSGGYLLVGHSESLSGDNPDLRTLAPSIYQKK